MRFKHALGGRTTLKDADIEPYLVYALCGPYAFRNEIKYIYEAQQRKQRPKGLLVDFNNTSMYRVFSIHIDIRLTDVYGKERTLKGGQPVVQPLTVNKTTTLEVGTRNLERQSPELRLGNCNRWLDGFKTVRSFQKRT
jgi:hypothetical protein